MYIAEYLNKYVYIYIKIYINNPNWNINRNIKNIHDLYSWIAECGFAVSLQSWRYLGRCNHFWLTVHDQPSYSVHHCRNHRIIFEGDAAKWFFFDAMPGKYPPCGGMSGSIWCLMCECLWTSLWYLILRHHLQNFHLWMRCWITGRSFSDAWHWMPCLDGTRINYEGWLP